MPRQLALVFCLIIIFYLFKVDRERNGGVSRAIWLPFLWIFPESSRSISQWLNLVAPNLINSYTVEEGSPIDRVFFLLLILGGIIVLRQRELNWRDIFTQNLWVWLYFVFGAVSFIWSDYPMISFRRWNKSLGTVIMVLVVLTEVEPYAAIRFILNRLALVFIPLSVLFVKFYPEFGRSYHMGAPMFIGVSSQKNGLGQLCFLTILYFSWQILITRNKMEVSNHRLHYSIYLVILPMTVWLLCIANSATAIACTIVSICLFILCKMPAITKNPRRVLILCGAFIVLYGITESVFDMKAKIINMLGRRPDLTTRVPMWNDLLAMAESPLIGTGFESFWLGERRQFMDELWGISGQAHNGYLEMYLNLGIIGVIFVAGWIFSGLIRVYRHLGIDFPDAIFRLCLIITISMYNYTEASFYGVSNLWMLLLVVVMKVPNKNYSPISTTTNR